MIKEADVFFALLSLIIHPMMYKRQKKPPLFHNNPMIILCMFPIHCIHISLISRIVLMFTVDSDPHSMPEPKDKVLF